MEIDRPSRTTVLIKQLTRTDKERQFIVPSNVLDQFPVEQGRCQRNFTAFDPNGKGWRFVLAIRRRSRYRKPILRSAEWHALVVEHGLNRDDGKDYWVEFFTWKNEPNMLQVRGLIKLAITFNGEPIFDVA